MKTSTVDADAQAAQFVCDGCGGVQLYDPASRSLLCRQCHQPGDPSRLAGDGPGAREIRLDEGMTQAARGLGLATQSVQCNACGATVALEPTEQAGACIYCASPMIVTRPAVEPPIRPESLVPFVVSQAEVGRKFDDWIGKLWFRRGDLKRLARVEKQNGVYVPYWTFDADVHSEWSAERGWRYKEMEVYSETENGLTVSKTREVTRTRWEPASGERDDRFDDHLVCASAGVPEKLADKLTSFETTELVPYSPGYLSGWRAERYAINLPEAWKKAQQGMERVQHDRCHGDVGGDEVQSLEVKSTFANETFKHVLLPIYVLAYRYQDKPFQVLVNGQTGEIVGAAPYSFWKIFLTVLASVALAVALYFLLAR